MLSHSRSVPRWRAPLGISAAAVAIFAAVAMAGIGAGQSAPPADQVEEGRYLVVLGDCEGCHTRPDGERFAGGLGLKSPFGTIYTANITPDPQTGIGRWSEADFYRAMHKGRDDQDAHLYPAFPYPYFTKLSRDQVDAIRAYLMTQAAVHYTPPKDKLSFPMSIRGLVGVWNALYFHEGAYRPDAAQSGEWNRGAFIVTGPAHCGDCHTPKTALYGDKAGEALQGGVVEGWFAPDLTGDARAGLGSWSNEDVVAFLKTGRNARTSAAAPMAEVISHSTAHMSDADLAAIATYLKSLRAPKREPDAFPVDAAAMAEGADIYRTAKCVECHKADGAGVPYRFPRLAGDSNAQQSDPKTIVRYILAGTRPPGPSQEGGPKHMPAFAEKLSDREIADVATYVRNSWGNAARPVSTDEVAAVRRATAQN